MAELTPRSCCGTVLVPGSVLCPYCGRPVGLSQRLDDDATAPAAVRLLLAGRVVCVLAEGDELVLGRLSADREVSDALNPFDHVSRRHAHLRWQDGRLLVSDSGSTNGTQLDGTAVGEQPVELTPPARLVLGDQCEFTIETVEA